MVSKIYGVYHFCSALLTTYDIEKSFSFHNAYKLHALSDSCVRDGAELLTQANVL